MDQLGNYGFVVEIGRWEKQNQQQGAQKFVFQNKEQESIIKWYSYLEFAKSKCSYNEFTSKFGQITFPLRENFFKN